MNILNCLDKVTIKEQWESERENVRLLFEQQVYGKIPSCTSISFSEEKCEDNCTGVKIVADDKVINAHLYMPESTKAPLPVFIFMLLESFSNSTAEENYMRMPYKEINARGYAVISFSSADIAADRKNGAENCVISKWAYGYSRIIDYVEKNKDLDSSHIAVAGHSRGGKTALWCGANDKRVWLTVSNNSGCSGAAVTRGKRGETIADIYGRFPYWFCENYGNYVNNEEEMPFDQHMLLALIAPRNLYVSSSADDWWADPEKEYEGLKLSQHIFDICGGKTGYHVKPGAHSITPYDWEKFMDFADNLK